MAIEFYIKNLLHAKRLELLLALIDKLIIQLLLQCAPSLFVVSAFTREQCNTQPYLHWISYVISFDNLH